MSVFVCSYMGCPNFASSQNRFEAGFKKANVEFDSIWGGAINVLGRVENKAAERKEEKKGDRPSNKKILRSFKKYHTRKVKRKKAIYVVD